MTRARAGTVLVVHPGADRYGSDLQVLESVSGLLADGWDVKVVLPQDGPLVQLLSERGAQVAIVDFPVVRRSFLSVRGLAKLASHLATRATAMHRTLRAAHPDVVYVNTTTLPWWLVVARLARRPTVCHVHEAEGDRDLLLKILNTPLRMADLVIVNSESARAVLLASVPALRRRSRLIYNGVADRPEPPVAAPHGPTTRLGVVTRLSPRKAPDVALDAARTLLSQGRDVEIEIAGTCFPGYEGYVEQLHAQAETPPLTGRVTFSGYVAPVYPVYDRADVVLAPSLRESFGNVVVEAQLSSRPVVAAASTGHTETVQHGTTGLLVPPGDAAAMAGAVGTLIDDPDLARTLGERGRRVARERFGIDRYRREICQAIESVAS